MIQEYDRLKKDQSYQAVLFRNSIEKSLRETEQMPDGRLRVRAIELVYIKKTHTIAGAAQKLYVSRATLQRWLSDYVDKVARHSGFTSESPLKCDKANKGTCYYDQEKQRT